GATNISRKSAIREHINTEDHNNAEKLESSRIHMESLQKEFISSNANTNHIICVMRTVYFLAKKNLALKLLLSVVELLKESGSSDLFNNDGQELYKQLAFLFYFYDILEHVTQLSKFLQKRNLKFSDIDPMIQATIHSIQKEYILIDQNQRFGQNVQIFIDKTNLFENSLITYLDNNLSFIEQDYDEFIMDVYDYSTNVINELQHRFPNRQLFTSMKILNPREWPNNPQELLFFGDNDLKILLKYFE
ncbi:7150_t:CDS:2, partial [Racocetra fulgida]